MANEDLITQYNQLIWQMEQLRAEANDAGESYALKLKNIAKKMRHVNELLGRVSQELTRRQVPIGPVALVSNGDNNNATGVAGFLPQGAHGLQG
jgi:hypothetical protein